MLKRKLTNDFKVDDNFSFYTLRVKGTSEIKITFS